jgi:hypothetical protein
MDPIYSANVGTIGPCEWSDKNLTEKLGQTDKDYPIKEVKLTLTTWDLKGSKINLMSEYHLTPIIGKLLENVNNDMGWEEAKMEAIKDYCILELPNFDLSSIPNVLKSQPNYFRIYNIIIELETNPFIKGIITQVDRDKKIGKLLE